MTLLRALLNRFRRRVVRGLLFRVVFGERSQANAGPLPGLLDPLGGPGVKRQVRGRHEWRSLPHTRISPSTCIEHEDRLVLGDHVYIGHFNLLEASGGITLGEGVQITSHCAIVTHSSHRAMRLLGEGYANWPGDKPGWVAGPVEIGPYSFVGPHSLIEANTRLGRGTLVCAGSFVRGEYPDFAILEGRPARIVGDSRHADEKLLATHPELRVLYDAWAGSAP